MQNGFVGAAQGCPRPHSQHPSPSLPKRGLSFLHHTSTPADHRRLHQPSIRSAPIPAAGRTPAGQGCLPLLSAPRSSSRLCQLSPLAKKDKKLLAGCSRLHSRPGDTSAGQDPSRTSPGDGEHVQSSPLRLWPAGGWEAARDTSSSLFHRPSRPQRARVLVKSTRGTPSTPSLSLGRGRSARLVSEKVPQARSAQASTSPLLLQPPAREAAVRGGGAEGQRSCCPGHPGRVLCLQLVRALQ